MADPVHEEYMAKRAKYVQMICDAKLEHWLEWLEHIDASSIWIAHKFIDAAPSDGSRARIPTLKVKNADGTTRHVEDNAGKAEALHHQFFFAPPVHPLVPENVEYLEPCT